MTNSIFNFVTVERHEELAVRPLELAPVAERHELPSVICHTLIPAHFSYLCNGVENKQPKLGFFKGSLYLKTS